MAGTTSHDGGKGGSKGPLFGLLGGPKTGVVGWALDRGSMGRCWRMGGEVGVRLGRVWGAGSRKTGLGQPTESYLRAEIAGWES